jgi:hypothetical protein
VDRAETARLEAEAARRQAELEAATDARRASDLAARSEAEQLEAESLALSAVLDDDILAAIVGRVTPGMSGLLAGSAVAVTRAVVAWCRAAATTDRRPLDEEAITAGLAEGVAVGEGHPFLDLPDAPAGTAPLRRRVADFLKAGAF